MNLLKLRNEIKSKKPGFARDDSNVMPQFKGKWRKPKGIHNKMRRGFRGHRYMPSIGYSSPRSARGLMRNGLKQVLIFNIGDLKKIKENCVAVISGNIGKKKKCEILKKAKEENINVFGIKNIDDYINNLLKVQNKNLKEEKNEPKK